MIEDELKLCADPFLLGQQRVQCLNLLAGAWVRTGLRERARWAYGEAAGSAAAPSNGPGASEARLRLIDLDVWKPLSQADELDLVQGNQAVKPYLLFAKAVYPNWRAVAFLRVAQIYGHVAEATARVPDRSAAQELGQAFRTRSTLEWFKGDLSLGWFLQQSRHLSSAAPRP